MEGIPFAKFYVTAPQWDRHPERVLRQAPSLAGLHDGFCYGVPLRGIVGMAAVSLVNPDCILVK